VDVEDLRLAVYSGFRERGRAPTIDELAVRLAASADDVRAGLDELAAARHVVLGSGAEIVMAHPFSAVPLGFSVMGSSTLWWGGCCWDSFAVPHLLTDEPDVLVASRCPGCDRPGAWVVGRDGPPESAWLAHFLVPVAHMWDDVVHTCSNQRLFCSAGCIRDWLDRNGLDEGAVMDVPTLWRLASRWYEGRLDRGYVRREPAESRDYLRSVGLVGPFWGS
jgi:Alkylmercury lyase